MTLVDYIVGLGIMCAAVHWILARSYIMRWFWSRLRGWPAKLISCPACSGFWLGAALTPIGFKFFDGTVPSILANAFFGLVLTPVFEAVVIWGLETSAIGPPTDPSVGTDE